MNKITTTKQPRKTCERMPFKTLNIRKTNKQLPLKRENKIGKPDKFPNLLP